MHQLHLRLGLPAEGGSVADDLDRERLAVLASDLEDLAEGAAAEVAENLVALAVGRGDDVGHRHDQVALLIVRATEQQTGRKTARAGRRAGACTPIRTVGSHVCGELRGGLPRPA